MARSLVSLNPVLVLAGPLGRRGGSVGQSDVVRAALDLHHQWRNPVTAYQLTLAPSPPVPPTDFHESLREASGSEML